MKTTGTVFSRPANPAAKCLQLIRLNSVMTRGELIEATSLSQPTITRAISALLGTGLIAERLDLTQSVGRGRPIVPVELAENNWMLAGIAVGTKSTYIALYDTRGRVLKEEELEQTVAQLSTEDFIEHIMAAVNRLQVDSGRTLVSVGMSTSGRIDDKGLVYAPNLGWEGMDIAGRLRYQFSVPVTLTSVVPAILGSETQAADFTNAPSVMIVYADDSLGVAVSDSTGVRAVELPELHGRKPEEILVTGAIAEKLAQASDRRAILDERARLLGTMAARLIATHRPDTLVIAGGAFYDDDAAPKLFATEVRAQLGNQDADTPQLRMVPNHKEIVRAVARAVAMDPLVREPLKLHA